MTTRRYTAPLAALACLVGLSCFSPAVSAEPAADDQAIDHIRLLEKMLRDAGVQPPDRPNALRDTIDQTPKPIVAPSFASEVLRTEVKAINKRDRNAANAIRHVRRWLERDDVRRKVAAQDVIKSIEQWAAVEYERVEQAQDKVNAYIYADDAILVLGQDPLAKPFKSYLKALQQDRAAWREIESKAAFRRAMIEAERNGFTGDWESIDFQNNDVIDTIKSLTEKLTLITNRWSNSPGAKSAEQVLRDWEQRQAQALADLPAWRYTWQMDLIQVGTEQKTTILTASDGTIILDEDTDIVYDPNNVVLYGTFQNTSDKPYRYTFLVGVSNNNWLKTPFSEIKKNRLIGYELVQTPVLAPGELFRWEAVLAVESIRNLNRAGIGMVEPHELKARR